MKKSFKRHSITTKITLWFAIIVILITGVACGIMCYMSNIVVLREMKDNLISIVENNIHEAEISDEEPSYDDPFDDDYYVDWNGNILEIDGDFMLELNGNKCAIYKDDGTLIYGEDLAVTPEAAPFVPKKIRTVESSQGNFFVYDMRMAHESLSGLWVRGIVAEAHGHSQIRDIVRMAFLLIPLFVIVAVFLTWAITRYLLRPLKSIAVTADHINNSGDLNQRLNIDNEGGSDEAYKLAVSFNGMLDRLEASFNEEKRFLSDASHELRTPLAVNAAQCEYILSKDRSSSEYVDALLTIQGHTRKMSRLVGDLLDYTRIDSKGRQIELVRTDLTRLVEETSIDMELLAERGISLDYSCEADVYILADGGLMARALINLISNSFRYGKDGGHVTVNLKTSEGNAVIQVIDNGIGIAPEDIGNIFKRFYQADRSRMSEGSGLGLAMVDEIVRIHHGTINVKSSLGQGSTFELILPALEKNINEKK